mgnify:CR=1 FL=1
MNCKIIFIRQNKDFKLKIEDKTLTLSLQCSIAMIPDINPQVPSNEAPVNIIKRLGVTNNLFVQL